MSNIVPVQGQTYPSPVGDTSSAAAVSNQGSNFSYTMGQVTGTNTALTPSLASSLMYRSMTTGVPNAEFDQYGGYSAVKAMFDANGGSYSLDAISSAQRQDLAQQMAASGTGNMSLLVSEHVSLLPSGLAEMAKNGIDSAPIVQKIQAAQASPAQGFSQLSGTETSLTPAVAQSLMHRSMTTGVPNTEMDAYGGYDAVKAMYDANGGSYSTQDFSAAEKQTLAQQVASSGVGNLALPISQNISISPAVLQTMRDNGIDLGAITSAGQGFSQLSGNETTLTPAVAQGLMHRSMTTGVPKTEMDSYGGYDAVKAMYDANNGSYGTQDFSAAEKQTLAQQVASSGVGNLALPISQNVSFSSTAMQALSVNGIYLSTLTASSSSYSQTSSPFVDSNSFIDSFMGNQK
jgi:putative effector of murein hydrolase